MPRIEGEIVIERPVDEVFDFVADERNEPRYNPRLARVEQLSAGPIGTGTRFRAEITMRRQAVPMTIEITAYERARRLASTTRMSSMEIEGTLTFDAVAGGTRMRWLWKLTPHGPLKLMSPVMARIGDRQERAVWGSLKRLLEAQT